MAPGYFHVHAYCSSEKWVEEFSRYDAGWLHAGKSRNMGDLFRVMWDDLNIPARMGTLAAAGLPMIQRRNSEHIVVSKELLIKNGIGILYDSIEELSGQLHNEELMDSLKNNVLKHRMEFTMDEHIPELVRFFKLIIQKKYGNG